MEDRNDLYLHIANIIEYNRQTRHHMKNDKEYEYDFLQEKKWYQVLEKDIHILLYYGILIVASGRLLVRVKLKLCSTRCIMSQINPQQGNLICDSPFNKFQFCKWFVNGINDFSGDKKKYNLGIKTRHTNKEHKMTKWYVQNNSSKWTTRTLLKTWSMN